MPRESLLGRGSIVCPECHAPVALAGPALPSDRLDCRYCTHTGALREYLKIGAPTRPTRVVLRVIR